MKAKYLVTAEETSPLFEIVAGRVEEIKLQSPDDAIEVATEEEAATGAVRNGPGTVEGEAAVTGAVASVELLLELEGAATFFTRGAGAAFFPSKLGTMTK